MKALTVVFGIAVAGVVVSLGGGIYTAIHLHHQAQKQEQATAQKPIPVPALAH